MNRPAQKAIYLIFQIIKFKVSIFPRRMSLFFGRVLGLVFYHLDKRHRRVALKNLTIAFGHSSSPRERRKIARGSFMHFGQVLMDLIKFMTLSPEKRDSLLTVSGGEHLVTALGKGKGALIVTAHYGNWEMGISGLAQFGKVDVIARALDNEFIERALHDLRAHLGAKVIYKNQAVRQTFRALEDNRIVAILIDQNVLRDQAIFVDFFGKKAATTPALAMFQLRSNAPVIPGFCYPTPSHKYHMQLYESVQLTLSGDRETDVTAITQACTQAIEEQIRQNPQYWLWFHDRWRTQPEVPFKSAKI
ncbi:lysophospholipid acyltransferase family protein [Acidobacteriota bacterium]